MIRSAQRFPLFWLAGALCLYVLAFLAVVVLMPLEKTAFEAIENIGGIFPPLVAGIIALKAAFRRAPDGARRRLAWALIGGGCLAWSLGEATWTFYALVLSTDTPFPSIADFFYLSAYPLLFVGILRLSSPRDPFSQLRTGLDAVAVVMAVAALLWHVLLRPVYDDSSIGLLEKVLTGAYPLGNLALLFAALVATSRVRQGHATAMLTIFSAGLAAIMVTDLVFSYLSLDDAYSGSSIIDVGWVAGFCLIAYASAMGGERLALAAPRVIALETLSPRQLVPLAILPFGVGWLYFGAFAGSDDLPTGVFGVAFVGLVTLRQAISFLDALGMHSQLRVAYDTVSTARAELAQQSAQLAMNLIEETERATTDSLTGVLNRRAIGSEVEAALQRDVDHGDGFALGMIDIDSLKLVNDRHGHIAGDELIQKVARALQVGNAIVGRYGGDEFVVILPSGTDVLWYAGEVRSRIRHSAIRFLRGPAAVSIGFAQCPSEGVTANDLLRLADSRMYVEKVRKHSARLDNAA